MIQYSRLDSIRVLLNGTVQSVTVHLMVQSLYATKNYLSRLYSRLDLTSLFETVYFTSLFDIVLQSPSTVKCEGSNSSEGYIDLCFRSIDRSAMAVVSIVNFVCCRFMIDFIVHIQRRAVLLLHESCLNFCPCWLFYYPPRLSIFFYFF
jgi:hypothetical protein